MMSLMLHHSLLKLKFLKNICPRVIQVNSNDRSIYDCFLSRRIQSQTLTGFISTQVTIYATITEL